MSRLLNPPVLPLGEGLPIQVHKHAEPPPQPGQADQIRQHPSLERVVDRRLDSLEERGLVVPWYVVNVRRGESEQRGVLDVARVATVGEELGWWKRRVVRVDEGDAKTESLIDTRETLSERVESE
jgi:hypothetical protein